MIRNELKRDTVEIWQRRNSGTPGGGDVITATLFPLPHGAGVHKFDTPTGTVTVDMRFENINPANETQHAVVKGPHTGGKIEVELKNGRGRSTPTPDVEVVCDVFKLTNALKAMHAHDSRPRKGW
ncbi:MAG TPA: hypothetical protein VM077_03670 [Candidatus Limnocylindrales bacterium]|nr:hypothetical protein [Candidatus Limnocylindrales bacterium]